MFTVILQLKTDETQTWGPLVWLAVQKRKIRIQINQQFIGKVSLEFSSSLLL